MATAEIYPLNKTKEKETTISGVVSFFLFVQDGLFRKKNIKKYTFWLTLCTFGCIIHSVRQVKTFGKEVRKMDEMKSIELVKLVEWLEANGFTAEKILECLKYISK